MDYINWIVRRLPSIPFVRLPDPRPNEPVITLTLTHYAQNPVAPPPRPIGAAGRKKAGRPPVRRSIGGPSNGAPGAPAALGSGKEPSSVPVPTGIDSAAHSDVQTPQSSSPQGSRSPSTDTPLLTQEPLFSGADRGKLLMEQRDPFPRSFGRTIPTLNGHQKNDAPAAESSMSASLNGRDQPSTSESLSLPQKRKLSIETLSTPAPKIAKAALPSPTTGMSNSRPQAVVTPRIEALIAPSSAS